MTDTATRVEATRERLVASAIELLRDESYPAVGVKAICDKADVQKGSFYHFFSSKEDLTIAAVDTAWERFQRHVIEPLADNKGDEQAMSEAMWTACTKDAVGKHPRGCIFIRLAASVTDTEPALRERLGEIFREWAQLLGNGEPDWQGLAGVHGRLLLALTMDDQEPIRA